MKMNLFTKSEVDSLNQKSVFINGFGIKFYVRMFLNFTFLVNWQLTKTNLTNFDFYMNVYSVGF